MHQTSSHAELRQRRPWIFWLSISAVSLLVLLIIVRLSAPYAIKWATVSWLESQHLHATLVDVDIFLLDGLFIVKGLSAEDATGKGFDLKQLDVAWQWRPLRHRQFIIDRVGIGPLRLDLALYDNGDLSVGGIQLPAGSDNPQPAGDGKPWDLVLTNLDLSEIKICADAFGPGQELTQQSCSSLASLNWSGRLAVMASEQATDDQALPVYINGALELARPRACIKHFDAANALAMDYCAELGRLVWKGDIALNPAQQPATDGALPLYIKGGLDITDISVHNNMLDLALLSLQSLAVTDVSINTPDAVSIAGIQLHNLKALQRPVPSTASDAQAFAFDQLTLQSLKLAGMNDLTIDTIEISQASSYLQMQENGQPDLQAWLPASNEVTETKQKSEPGGFHFALDNFVFNSKQHFVYYDTSLKQPFKIDIHDVRLVLTNLDSKQADSTSHLALELMIGKHGSFKLDADLTPFADKPTIKGSGQITGIDLRLMAPMTRQHIGHNIKSGQLDSEIKIEVDKGVINSNLALTLNQFELRTLDKQEAKKLDSEFGFPLNSSLSLLRDRDNAIRLDIPVTGDIENPEFDPRDAIVKATSKAISAAVLHYYTPFGLVFAADALLDLATALRFEPVVFDTGTATLTNAHEEALNKLAALMKQRPGIHLTLCGLSNREDAIRLFPPDKQARNTAGDPPSTAPPMPPQHIGKLQQLAESRSAAIKNLLVDQHSINASRLIECSPEYVESGISGVEISI